MGSFAAGGADIRPQSKISNGTSSSGTAGTVIAVVTADAGAWFPYFTATIVCENSANTGAQCKLTFEDGTTETKTVAAANSVRLGTRSGFMRVESATTTAFVAFTDQAKRVTAISMETQSTGTGERNAAIDALQVPI